MAVERIQFRRGTAASWFTANPVLASGEPGFETDTHSWKMGDGSTPWNSLVYQTLGSSANTHTMTPIWDGVTGAQPPRTALPSGFVEIFRQPIAPPIGVVGGIQYAIPLVDSWQAT